MELRFGRHIEPNFLHLKISFPSSLASSVPNVLRRKDFTALLFLPALDLEVLPRSDSIFIIRKEQTNRADAIAARYARPIRIYFFFSALSV